MAVIAQCDVCHNLNAIGRQVCWKCNTKLPLHGKGLVKFIEWRRDGKKHRKSLGRIGLVEAQRVAAEVRHANTQRNRSTVIVVGGQSGVSWSGGLSRFISQKQIECVSANRLRTIKDVGMKMLLFFGNQPIVDISRDMVVDFLEQYRAKLAPATLSRYLKIGRAVFAFSCPDMKNPFSGIVIKQKDRPIMPLTREQEQALLDVAEGDLREIIITTLATGLRRGSVLGLRWDQVDLDNKIIRITQKGGKNHVLPLAQSVVDILSHKERNSAYVWPSHITGKPYHTLARQWASVKRRAGIPKSFRFHDLRHTVGTRIVESRGDIRYAQEVLGHASSDMTMRYAHIVSDRLREVIEEIAPKTT